MVATWWLGKISLSRKLAGKTEDQSCAEEITTWVTCMRWLSLWWNLFVSGRENSHTHAINFNFNAMPLLWFFVLDKITKKQRQNKIRRRNGQSKMTYYSLHCHADLLWKTWVYCIYSPVRINTGRNQLYIPWHWKYVNSNKFVLTSWDKWFIGPCIDTLFL